MLEVLLPLSLVVPLLYLVVIAWRWRTEATNLRRSTAFLVACILVAIFVSYAVFRSNWLQNHIWFESLAIAAYAAIFVTHVTVIRELAFLAIKRRRKIRRRQEARRWGAIKIPCD